MAKVWVALAGAALALGLCGWALFVWRRWRRLPGAEEGERRRRLRIEAEGKVCDAVLIELRNSAVCYRYEVGGIEYVASQDISALLDRVPAHLAGLTGHASVKYLPENPANSIVVSENWCGLHRAVAQAERRDDTPPGKPDG